MKNLLAIFALLCGWTAFGAEVIPPSPARHFNDYAGVVSAATASRLDQQLLDFERQSSCQLVAVVFPKMQTDSSIEDYATRVFRAWGVGQQKLNNGAVLFVFVQDHKMRIQTGYGLEGALPDALCKRILDDEISPQFKAGNFDAGLTAGVTAMIAAAKGEYQPTNRPITASAPNHTASHSGIEGLYVFLFFVLFVGLAIFRARRMTSGAGWVIGSMLGGGWTSPPRSGGWGGGWSGGGGGGGGGFGGFSGGGGSTGGGGASGGW